MQYESLQLVLDTNGDGRYQRWEIMDFLHGVYHLPGNLILETLGQWPQAAALLGVQASEATGYASLNSLPAVALSLVVWAGLLVALLNLRMPARQSTTDRAASPARPLTLPPPEPPRLRY